MSSNVPPAFKPIAHYIKIANENASRDPVVYYWWMCMMALGTSSGAHFDFSTWQRLQHTIRSIEPTTEQRDELRDAMEDVQNERLAEQYFVKIQEKTLRCDELRKKIGVVNQKILNGRRKIGEMEERIKEKKSNEDVIQKRSTSAEGILKQNGEKKEKLKKETEILIKLLRHRKMHMLHETLLIFKVRIDGGPASRNGKELTKTCNCQLIDTIRHLHLPHSPAPFDHPETPTITALHHFLHLFDVFCRILDYSPKNPFVLKNARIRNNLKTSEVAMETWRRNREKFEEAMGWIGMNVGQLRIDCGIPTMTWNRPMASLVEWLELVEQREVVFERPRGSAFTPANLLVKELF